MVEDTHEAFQYFSTEELDTLFIGLDDRNADLRKKVADEIKERVRKLKDAQEEES